MKANPHIELVKKYLDPSSSVTRDELGNSSIAVGARAEEAARNFAAAQAAMEEAMLIESIVVKAEYRAMNAVHPDADHIVSYELLCDVKNELETYYTLMEKTDG